MSGIQEQIMDTFFEELAKLDSFDAVRIQKLKEIFDSPKKPKGSDVADVFSHEEAEEVK